MDCSNAAPYSVQPSHDSWQSAGPLPASWSSLNIINVLAYNNSLTGSLPAAWGSEEGWIQVVWLDFTGNRLTGVLSQCVACCQDLKLQRQTRVIAFSAVAVSAQRHEQHQAFLLFLCNVRSYAAQLVTNAFSV